ncbi:MAG TPA: lytic murein transglycosylase B [Steroidobacteraceae bacterium]|nr:lytic murein transglycosylase B [Steroidobacteraceae bacterium]
MRRGFPRAPIVALMLLCSSATALAEGFDVSRDDIQKFVDTMVSRHRFDREQVTALLASAQPQPGILEAIQRPAERTLAWWEYRQRFITPERIERGVQVWREHADDLARIAAQSGVPAEYLIAITGVETFYGRITGRYRVIDSLATLGFDYPPRGEFFRKELEQFLMMAREERLDPREPLGSYAGAMGIPQFMPSSFRRFAVDGTGDGHRNLWEEGADVFASVGNYLREHGWRAGQPVLADASIEMPVDDPANFKLSLSESVASLRERGYMFESTLPGQAKAMLVPAQQPDAVQWRVGFQNFYAITRYNRSPLYAMAVYELAGEIAARFRAAPLAAQPAAASAGALAR